MELYVVRLVLCTVGNVSYGFRYGKVDLLISEAHSIKHFLESPAHWAFLCNNVLPVGSFLWRSPIFMFLAVKCQQFRFSPLLYF